MSNVVPLFPRTRVSTSRRSRKEEEALAERMGAQRQSGSGNQPNKRGDLRAFGWLGEVKNTDDLRFRVTRPVLDKIVREADAVLLKPFLAVGFWTMSLLRAAREDYLYGFRVDDISEDIAGMEAPHRTVLGRHSAIINRADIDAAPVHVVSPLLVYLTGRPTQGWVFLPERDAFRVMGVDL